jgi:integrase
VNRLMQPVKAIFNELFADGEITVNPAIRLGKLKEKRIAEIDPFADEEVKVLIKKVMPWYRPYTEFLFESGFRPKEAMGLKWSCACVTSVCWPTDPKAFSQSAVNS